MNNKTHKFNNQAHINLKKHIITYTPLKEQIIEGNIDLINASNNQLLVDFGFRTNIEVFSSELQLRVPLSLSLTKKCNYIKKFSQFNFKLTVLQHFFLNEILIQKHSWLNFMLLVKVFKKQKNTKKYQLKGRILNETKGGYAIGFTGLVGFLPKSHAFLRSTKRIGLGTSFYIISVNKSKKTFLVSQRRIGKILKRRLSLLLK